MAFHQMHLNKSGSGMASKTACGRNILRTPLSTNFEEFKNEKHQCTKCAESKFFAFLTKQDAKKEQTSIDAWEPEADDAWIKADDALIAAKKK